jgi:hypothetical protein
MFTRREFGTATLGAFAGLGRLQPDATSNGVRLGVQTYSFRDVPRTAEGDMIEPLIRAMVACGFTECELWAPQVEPPRRSREELRTWRLQTPIGYFRAVKRKFDAAKITICGYNYSRTRATPMGIDRGFAMAKALGAEIITASATLDVASGCRCRTASRSSRWAPRT